MLLYPFCIKVIIIFHAIVDLMTIPRWFHPFLTRHSAECMLIDNAPEGSYLLRPSATGGKDQYTLSVKYAKHQQRHMLNTCIDRHTGDAQTHT